MLPRMLWMLWMLWVLWVLRVLRVLTVRVLCLRVASVLPRHLVALALL